MKEQRKLTGMRAYIDELLTQGWNIVSREPLALSRGNESLRMCSGMLLSE